MFNTPSNPPPRKPPLPLQLTLRPWLDSQTLEEALGLLADGKIDHFFFYRHMAAALVDNAHPLYILFAPVNTIRQGFTLKDHYCSYCGPKTLRERCPHLAALTILSLISRDDDGRSLYPMPLHFEKTGWKQIADFLYSWLGGMKGKTVYRLNGENLLIEKRYDHEGIRCALPSATETWWRGFFHAGAPSDEEAAVHALRQDILERTLSKTERTLAARGAEGKGAKRDASLWSALCREFSLLSRGRLPAVNYDEGSRRLTLSDVYGTGRFTITLPPNKTWELISALRPYALEANILPPAKECFQVDFPESGRLRVRPSLRREGKKQLLAAADLAPQKMGGCYFLPDSGFLPVQRIEPQAKIVHPDCGGPASLFDFSARAKEAEQPFTVDNDLVPEFLRLNSHALRHPDNRVDPAILEITTTALPHKLFIDTFAEEHDWCYISCHYGMGDTTISLEEILAATTEKAAAIPGRQWLQLSDSPLSWLYDLLPERLTRNDDGRSILRLHPSEFMALTALIPNTSNRVEEKDAHELLSTLLNSESWSDCTTLEHYPEHLRNYQRQGLAWLSSLHRFGLGGLLADDMGLGKTHQGLALLEAITSQSKQSAQLVICPASVLHHWKNKIDEFYPRLNYSLHYGPGRSLDSSKNPGLILTTYGIARHDRDLLASFPFDIILLDEIQNLKNRRTGVHQAVAALSARIKIGLTGTPIENSLSDLHSLFSICLPGFFGSEKQFSRTFITPIREKKDKDVEERLRRLIHPFILRRNRKQVLTELPELTVDHRDCELSDTQVKLYRDAVNRSQDILDDMEREGSSRNYTSLLAVITRLKQICNHPCLIEGCTEADRFESGKWDLFIELLEECLEANLKIVVFSQYTGMLDLIEDYLDRTGISFAGLRGDMTLARREKMLHTFSSKKSCKVFCASLLAGGTGIDLVAAQVVIHYDRWWNPAKEAQATARVHRMGQKQPVQVFHLITTGTLEEKIHALLQQKQEMADSMIREDEEGILKKLDRDRLRELLQPGREW